MPTVMRATGKLIRGMGATFLLIAAPVGTDIACAETITAQAQRPTQARSVFPGGATTIQEAYADWRIACNIRDDAKQCRIMQEQLDSKTHQRVLAIELQKKGEGLQGMLLLPFGLALKNGVTLQIDGSPPSSPLQFETCLPNGCVVPLALEANFVKGLAHGAALKVNAVVTDGDKTVSLNVSLKGFDAACSRLSALLK